MFHEVEVEVVELREALQMFKVELEVEAMVEEIHLLVQMEELTLEE